MTTTNELPRFCDVSEACRRLCCSRAALYRDYIDTRKLIRVKRGGKALFLSDQITAVVLAESKAAGVPV